MSIPTDPKSSLRHFWAGFVPAAAAILLLLVQSLRPFVPHEQQGILLTLTGWLVCVTLAVWTWCVVQDTAGRFERRNETADTRQQLLLQQIADNHQESQRELKRQSAAIQALHGRLEAIERRLGRMEKHDTETDEDIEHLRSMVLRENLADFGERRLGPRPLS
ncbi:hypothetical protein [Glycomyces paridis]|uniref:Uncharacterized protein n=1 Tax=Glycomyces paridis TaxID=2126555 RepID=A0A4S8PC58_9ACTN|nr:hypothetical protein [Glycomyces paridis]THV27908.1 hypothetical protein E9998_13020 [Glycomyces paridis]